MSKQTQPVKRSRQLAPLSREHHEGLLFVWKIKQGIAFGITPARIASYCEWFWHNILKDHFKKEETALTRLLPATDPLLNTMIEDHQAIIEKIEQVTDDPSYYSLQRLAQIIYYNIRFEERNLFVHIEQMTPIEVLETASSFLLPAQHCNDVWTDEFWIGKSAKRSSENSYQNHLTNLS